MHEDFRSLPSIPSIHTDSTLTIAKIKKTSLILRSDQIKSVVILASQEDDADGPDSKFFNGSRPQTVNSDSG